VFTLKQVQIREEAVGAVRVLVVEGFMDMREVPKFDQALDKLIKAGQVKIVLDLSQLEYISSAGLGSIIGNIRRVRTLGGDIKVGGHSATVFEILRTFGFTEVFDTCSTRAEAVKKYGS
jgi:anti-sigma B factor antagonist